MSDQTLHLPRDFQLYPEYQELEAQCGAATALGLWVRLWARLAYTVQGGRFGALSGPGLDAWLLKEMVSIDANALKLSEPPQVVELYRGKLVETQTLIAEDGLLACPRFREANRHLAPDYTAPHLLGGQITKWAKQAKLLEKSGAATQLALTLDQELFKGCAPDESRRLLLLIMNLDSALQRPKSRLKSEVTPGLVAAALAAVRAHSDAELRRACENLIRARGSAMAPASAEEVLRDLAHWTFLQPK